MKYIKQYKIFEFTETGDRSQNSFKNRFGISPIEIYDVLSEVKDEIPDIEFWIDDAECSTIVGPDNANIFVIYFERMSIRSSDSWRDRDSLYDLESFLNKGVLDTLNSHLKEYGLSIYVADYGESDVEYEIVVNKIHNHNIKPTEEYKRRYPHV